MSILTERALYCTTLSMNIYDSMNHRIFTFVSQNFILYMVFECVDGLSSCITLESIYTRNGITFKK